MGNPRLGLFLSRVVVHERAGGGCLATSGRKCTVFPASDSMPRESCRTRHRSVDGEAGGPDSSLTAARMIIYKLRCRFLLREREVLNGCQFERDSAEGGELGLSECAAKGTLAADEDEIRSTEGYFVPDQ